MSKTGRNQQCPCGSGKKYKTCCLRKDEEAQRQSERAALPPAGRPSRDSGENDGLELLDSRSNRVIDLIDEGRLDEAAAVLTALAHATLARGGHDAEEEARGLLERIRAFAAATPDPVLVRRLEAAPAPAVASAPDPVAARVLFVGGNETQERYREDVLRWVAERWPNVAVTFEFPGWSSNWGRELPRVENLVRQSDAVVLMRYVRTLFGMHVRRMCSQAGIPWIACTGHGRDSMRNSIAAAVARCRG